MIFVQIPASYLIESEIFSNTSQPFKNTIHFHIQVMKESGHSFWKNSFNILSKLQNYTKTQVIIDRGPV